LLDEATASLDVDNETKIQRAISTLIKNKTVLIIAHRMRTVAKADNIVVLKGGELIEQGSHEQLLAQKKTYWTMWELQKASSEWKI
jgi:ATP-binding cassette subfamily B protein